MPVTGRGTTLFGLARAGGPTEKTIPMRKDGLPACNYLFAEKGSFCRVNALKELRITEMGLARVIVGVNL